MRGRRFWTLAALAWLLAPLALGSPAAAEPPRSFYGVAPQDIPSAADIERMAKGKVGTVRFQIRWKAVDPTPFPGDYDWNEIDPVVASAARNGIRAFPFVFSTPPWVATGIDSYACEPACDNYPPRSDAALAQWELFLSALARRYGPGGEFWAEHPGIPAHPIRAWQIWNEQNNFDFYRPHPSVSAYTRLLGAAARGIRDRDPSARIVLGGMYEPGQENEENRTVSALGFLRELYENRARKLFDVVAAHPYAAKLKGVRAQLNGFRDVMRDGGDARGRLWITELGWSSARGEQPLHVGPDLQATRLRRLLGMVTERRRDLAIGRFVWFAWRDSRVSVCEWCRRAGLFSEHGLRPKPVWRAFTEFTGGR